MRLLNRFRSRAPRKRPHGFVPRIESLESRLLLTCDVFQRESTVFIHGDDSNQAVQISDDGRGNIGVTCDGYPPASFSGIELVHVRLEGGDDVFSYLFAPASEGATSIVDLDAGLGAGADIAVLSLERGRFGFVDVGGARFPGTVRLRCELTLRDGAVVYDLNGLSARDWDGKP